MTPSSITGIPVPGRRRGHRRARLLADDHPDRIQIAFDDHRLVANAGLILPATLGRHLGLPQLVDRRLDLGNAPGRANTGDVLMARLREGRANTARGSAHFLRETVGPAGALRRGQGTTHGAGRQRLLYPRHCRRLP